MKHLVFPTTVAAEKRSFDEADRRNCLGDNTLYWWAVIPYANGQAAIAIGDDTAGLTPDEVSRLVPAPLVIEET